ncbi:putative nucleolar protein [Trypanosoma grayi]|uniref:putative nucleolar protein n=1 Tax=Trypanosoma grayi TaxID=71804 RepID=UPI0004F44A43|nr:putative nucleolar protein [Trypanosoma grayi]KEG10423.1 putative nucleolar protein [Trypanosoma grayi]
MVSLLKFAANSYSYAAPATQEYVQSTVFTPLGFSPSRTSLFASPPRTTNLRFVGAGTLGLEAQAREAVEKLQGHPHFRADLLDDWGMPYCLTVSPVTEGTAEADAAAASTLEITAEGCVPIVVVNVGCAEAVLRGSDVFAPGVSSILGSVVCGQRVCLALQLRPAKTENSVSGEEEGGDGLLVCVGYGTALMSRRAILQSQQKGGVAVRTEWTPMGQPSKSLLSQLLKAVADDATVTRNSVEGGVFFLQNYSSMAAVEVLLRQLGDDVFQGEKPLNFLDACAAPGGKASLLLSLLNERVQGTSLCENGNREKDEEKGKGPDFTLVCCERSPTRYQRLLNLLERHLGASFVQRVVRPFCGDVNKLQNVMDGGCEFHGILLDPPCTGMGLRPKLSPHATTVKGIRDSADYQRKLFDTCVKMLRREGMSVLVYSTCTITLDENEANVLWALNTYPCLRLARAKTEHDRRLCSLSTTNFADGRRFLLQSEINEAQRRNELRIGQRTLAEYNVRDEDKQKMVKEGGNAWEEDPLMLLRFMPGYAVDEEDGVGFFVAVFLCERGRP